MKRQGVFISYAREDESIALRLHADLAAHGIRVWIDKQNLKPGQDWKEAIRATIEKSAFVIVLLSSKATSKKGFVQSEIRLALQILDEHPPSAIYLVPVRVDRCQPEHRRLRELQWLDLFPSYDASLDRLVKVLKPRSHRLASSRLEVPPAFRSREDSWQIVNVGSMSIDTVHTPSGSYECAAGSSIYFAAAASLFSVVRTVAVVGRDFSFEQLDFLRQRQVDFAGVEIAEGNTFRWTGKYSPNLMRRETLEVELNSFTDFHPKIPHDWRCAPVVYLGNMHPALQLESLDQMPALKLSVADSMDFWIGSERRTLGEVLRRVSGLIVNEEELLQLTGDIQLHGGARQLIADGLRFVVVKRGDAGAMLVTRSGVFVLPAYPHPTLMDPTGTGDTFAGGFLGYLAAVRSIEDDQLRRAMLYGTVLASFVVEAHGTTRMRDIHLKDVASRMAEFGELTGQVVG